ncbi:MAG: lipopolysaccharide biosynthesis protein [Zoogloeaceae bacterium]|jgi:O-antigen/teichoic acid export membrane protein|nr:lipopolysaccharide biosynthesis protein [Zoogloeaceae bacterium]
MTSISSARKQMPQTRFSFSKLLAGPIARATLKTSAVLLLRLLVQAAFLLMVTRLLGTEMFGVFSGVAALAVLLGGMANAGTHLVLFSEVSVDPGRRDAVLRYALPISFVAGVSLLSIYVALALPLLWQTGLPIDIALAIGLGESMLQPFIMLIAMEMLAHNKTARSQLLLTLPLFIKLSAVFLIYLFVSENRLQIFSWSYLASIFLAFVIAKRHFSEKWPTWRTWRLPTLSELRHTSGYAILQFTASAPLEADKTLALRLLPLHTAGVYATGTRIICALVLPITAMIYSALPRLYRQHAETSSDKKKLYHWVFLATLVYSISIAIALAVIAPLFTFLFDASYADLTKMLQLLAFVVPAISLQISATNILMGQNRPWARAVLEFSGLMILLITAMTASFTSTESRMPLALGCAEWWLAIVGWVIIYSNEKNRT